MSLAELNARLASLEGRATVPSHRTTTSSRRPGLPIQGTVYVRRGAGQLVKCACGSYRYDNHGPHAPHWRNEVLVDCQGEPVP